MTEPEREPDGLDNVLRVVLLCIYLADLVVVLDLCTDGAMRRAVAREWRARVTAPLARRRALVTAERQVVFEAMTLLERNEPAA